MIRKQAVIIGAGPAGLTAALELVRRSEIHPIVLECAPRVGGLSCTLTHQGNRFDIGPHRFFSKSKRVTDWWFSLLPPAATNGAAAEAAADRVMLPIERLTRILYRRKLFDYPLSLNFDTLRRLGLITLAHAGLSYLHACARPICPENSLEDFLINRFGRELYRTFFKDYTEKVWGVPCSQIKPDWGAQRIKGLSISKAVADALKRAFSDNGSQRNHKDRETSLIQRFLYPKRGAGQMWEEAAASMTSRGGEILLGHRAAGLHASGDHIVRVDARDEAAGTIRSLNADYVISSMPVQELVRSLNPSAPPEVAEVARQLVYRDHVTVVVELRGFSPRRGRLPDNWIYVQEPDVRVARIQIHNNWSPLLVRDPSRELVGLEYFCQEGDSVWSMPDEALRGLAAKELNSLLLAEPEDVLDAVVVRTPKAYPAYFGGYEQFSRIRGYLDAFENLFLVGRNGMHKYNNMDHSMLTAMCAVDGILGAAVSKQDLWDINTEDEYHEEHGDAEK